MSCSKVNQRGEVTCSFSPTADQYGQVYNFCYMAEDEQGWKKYFSYHKGVTWNFENYNKIAF